MQKEADSLRQLNKKMCGEYIQYPEKVLQFGEGNFLRAFADWQIDQMNQLTDFNGSVVAVQPRGSEKIKRLNEQGGLFTLFLRGIKDGKPAEEHMIVKSISRGIDLFSDYDSFKRLAAQEELRFIISNTTEAGITFEKADRLEDRPQKTFPGKLAAFLYFRYKAFAGDTEKGCIVLPCELVEENGRKLKAAVLQYAGLWELEPDFTQWIHDANIFCNTLVDRIVPGFPVDTAEELTDFLGYEDRLLVVGEHYYLWVIEGPEQLQNELPFAEAGLNALITSDLTPYRTKKVRILNGAHTALAPVALLYGLQTVREAAEHEVTGRFIEELINEEILPVLQMEGVTQYAADVLQRFKNPYIQHYLQSITLNAAAKFKTRNLPTLKAYIEQEGRLPEKLVFSFSAMIYSYWNGPNKPADGEEVLNRFQMARSRCKDDMFQAASAILGEERLWGKNLNHFPGLTERTAFFLSVIHKRGMKHALHECCGKKGEVK
ncbi:tagaturonate reductase [Bacillus velezensis]